MGVPSHEQLMPALPKRIAALIRALPRPNPNATETSGFSYGGIRGSMRSGGWGSQAGFPGIPTDPSILAMPLRDEKHLRSTAVHTLRNSNGSVWPILTGKPQVRLLTTCFNLLL